MPIGPPTRDPDARPRTTFAEHSRRNAHPGLKQLRGRLVGARREMLKTTAFAAAVLTAVGLLVHHLHVASADDQFAANAGAAIGAFRNNLGADAGSVVAVAQHRVASTLDGATVALNSVAQPAGQIAPVDSKPIVRVKRIRTVSAAEPAPKLVHVAKHHRIAKHPTKMMLAAAKRAPISPAVATGPARALHVTDVSDRLGAETQIAYTGIMDFLQDCIEMTSFPRLHSEAQAWMNSFMSHFDLINPDTSLDVQNPAKMLSDGVSVDTAASWAAVLLFLVVMSALVLQVKGYLRGDDRGARRGA